MIGEGCPRDCAFCAQARSAKGPAGHLSRVTWPSYPTTLVVERLTHAARARALERVCLQTVAGDASLTAVRALLPVLTAATGLPVSTSVYLRDLGDLAELFALGLDRVGIAIDAASPEVYRRTKHGEQAAALDFLAAAAAAHPGRVSTHLIVGMGETEQESLTFVEWSLARGITVGLFAFTPVRGTGMAEVPAPPLDSYRRVQAATELMRRGLARLGDCRFDGDGCLVGINLSRRTVETALADGRAFETSGCVDCNRPYYNERPGHVPYNYPAPLSQAELADAMEPVLTLVAEPGRPAGDE
jgi:biotin synthase